jgi:hypothetical protein
MNAHASSEYSVDRLERQPRVRVAQFRSSVEMTEYLPTDPPILVGEPEQSQITRFETWKRVSHPNSILRTARYSHFSGGNLPRTSEARGHWKPVEVNKFQTTDPPILVGEPEPSQITRFETWKRVSHPNGILRTARYSHFSGGNLPRTSAARVHWKPKLSETVSYHRALPFIHVSRLDRHNEARARFERSSSQSQPRMRVAQFRSNGILRTARYSHFSGGNASRTSAARVHWKPTLSETVSYHRSLPSIHVSRQIDHDAKQKTQRRLWWKTMIVNTFMCLFFWKAATVFQVPAPQVVRSLPSQQLIFNKTSVAIIHLPELIASNASQVVYCFPASVNLYPILSSAVSIYVPIVSGKSLRLRTEAPTAVILSSAVSLYVEAKLQVGVVISSQLSLLSIPTPISAVYSHLERLRVLKRLALSKGVLLHEKRMWQEDRHVNCCSHLRAWRIVWEEVMVETHVQILVDVGFGHRMWRIAWVAVVVVGPGVLILMDVVFGRRVWRIAWVRVVGLVVGPGVLRFVEFNHGRRVRRIAWEVLAVGPGALRLEEFEFGRRVWRIAWSEIPLRRE